MKLRKNRRAFTIVELVIVIAVIGVIAAVLIPTFVNLVEKANKSADDLMLRNINLSLRLDEDRNETMFDAVQDASRAGYNVETLKSKKGEALVWNQETDEFAFASSANANHKYWMTYSEMPTSQTYSIYAATGWTATDLDVTVGFDIGSNEVVTDISYERTTGEAHTVIFRTFGGSLNINAPQDTVHHYVYLDTLDATAVAGDSYHEHGYLKELSSFGSGNFVAEEGAQFGQSKDELAAVLGSNSNNLDEVSADAFEVEDNYGEPERIEITQDNFTTVFSDNPDAEYFILTERVEVTSCLFLNGSGSAENHRAIDIDLNGKNITSGSTDHHCSLIDIQYTDLTLHNGGLINNNTVAGYNEIYNVVGGACTLTATNVSFGGSVYNKIGVMSGTIVLRLDECQMNDGFISAASTTIRFECEGTYKVSTPGFGQTAYLAPTVTVGEGYSFSSISSSYSDAPTDMEIYKEYVVVKD